MFDGIIVEVSFSIIYTQLYNSPDNEMFIEVWTPDPEPIWFIAATILLQVIKTFQRNGLLL